MYQPHPTNSLQPRNTDVLINGEAFRCTDSFTYLGSAVVNTSSSHLKIKRHVQSASKAFGALQKHLWSCHDVKLCTKIKVYNTAILPVLLYSTETMILVPTSPKTTHKDPAATFASYIAYKMARKGILCGGA